MSSLRHRASVFSASLVSALALAILLGRPAHLRADSPTTAPSPTLLQLQQQQIETLRRAGEFAQTLHAQGLTTFAEVGRINRLLLEAELEAASSAEARVKILKNALAAATKQEEYALAEGRAGVATSLASLEAKAYRLRVEIQLARESEK